jgi:hypothetical protein
MRVPGHTIHVVLPLNTGATLNDIIIQRPLGIEGEVCLPAKLRFEARWIYDLTAGKILKNKTGKTVIPCIDAVEVSMTWLADNGYGFRAAEMPDAGGGKAVYN